MNGPQVAFLPDGKRLHFNHGPMDLIIEAFGDEGEVRAAYSQAKDRFATVLEELVEELPALRSPTGVSPRRFRHSTARRMEAAASRFAGETFVTPMAGVAGAVADEVLAAMVADRRLERAYVNNGGDIAIHLSPGTSMKAAIAGTGEGFSDCLEIGFQDPVRGLATSGRHGRSHSLGIAEAVTVLAVNAAQADVAATLIANAVDLPGHPAIHRRPARELSPDSDLGDRLVTVAVDPLEPAEIDAALDHGARVAHDFIRRGLIEAAILYLAGRERICAVNGQARPPLLKEFAHA
jgi:ApbE superfamily uncharacterized protein (UPF0280 family)